jgi:hypothetical protein
VVQSLQLPICPYPCRNPVSSAGSAGARDAASGPVSGDTCGGRNPRSPWPARRWVPSMRRRGTRGTAARSPCDGAGWTTLASLSRRQADCRCRRRSRTRSQGRRRLRAKLRNLVTAGRGRGRAVGGAMMSRRHLDVRRCPAGACRCRRGASERRKTPWWCECAE